MTTVTIKSRRDSILATGKPRKLISPWIDRNPWFRDYLEWFDLEKYHGGSNTGEVRFRMPDWQKAWIEVLAGDHRSIEKIETAAWLYGFQFVKFVWGYDPGDLGKQHAGIKEKKLDGEKYSDLPSFRADEDKMQKQSTKLNIRKADLRDSRKIRAFLESNKSQVARHYLYIAAHQYDQESAARERWTAITPKVRDLTIDFLDDFERRMEWIEDDEASRP